MSTIDYDNLSGAYALHALARDEAEAHERFIARHEQSRAETIELSDTAVRLGLAVSELRPPERVGRELMALIAVTPQLPAVPTAVDAASADRPARSARRRATARRRRLSTISLVGSGALIAAATTAILVSLAAPTTPRIPGAEGSERLSAAASDGATMQIVWSQDRATALAAVVGGPALARDETYQFWYVSDGEARSAGIVDDGGWISLAGSPRAGETIAVTVEPHGGSTQPTSDPIAAVELG